MSRSRRRRTVRRSLTAVLLAGVVVSVAVSAVPASSYSTGTAQRGSSVAVASDETAVVGLDVATSVKKGGVHPLVNVTNRMGVPLTVTVTLTNPNTGELYYDGTKRGSSATFTLGAAGTPTAQVAVKVSKKPDVIAFDVTAESNGASVRAANRRVNVSTGPSSGGGSGGGGGPPCGTPPCGNGNPQLVAPFPGASATGGPAASTDPGTTNPGGTPLGPRRVQGGI